MGLIKKSGIFVALALIFILVALTMASAQILPYEVPLRISYETPFNYYGEAAQYYFPSFSKEMCEIGQDFIIEIPPGACTPAVVRSDLLEEQPVPIFCQLTGIKINPLIEVPHIRRIRVTQKEAHTDIATVLFHPARAGLQTSFASLMGSPTMNNLGYLVVVLKRKATEKEMPDMIEVNLTAVIEYEMERTFGIAENQILLEIMTDEEWKNTYEQYSFWKGRGYVRAKDIKEDKAKIEVYDGSLHHLRTFNLEEGEISDPAYMPGFYCAAGYKVRLEDIEYPAIRAELYVNDDKLIVSKGMTLQDSGCVVDKIIAADYGLGGTVRIRCPEGYYTLTKKATSKAKLIINEEEPKTFNIGDKIYDNLRLVYAGKIAREDEKPLKVIVVANVTQKISSVIKEYLRGVKDYLSGKKGYWRDREEIWKAGNPAEELADSLYTHLREAVEKITGTLKVETERWVIVDSGKINGIKIEIAKDGIEGLQKIEYDSTLEDYYKKAISTYKDVAEIYPDLVDKTGIAYGAKALWKAAEKAAKLDKTFDQAVLLEEIIREYPNSNFSVEARRKLADLYSTADMGKASLFIFSEGKGYRVELTNIIEPTREEINVRLSIDNSDLKTFTKHDLVAKDEWQISEIKEDRVHFKNLNTSRIEKISEGEEEWLGNTKVKVVEITLKKFARVSVIPWSREGITLTNFTFRVGIEKRAIKLSPEQTRDYIKKLDKTISKWENINTKLGNIVTLWKKTCLIGATALWVNNFFDMLSGKGIARRMVMRGLEEGQLGMIDECAALEAKGEYGSVSECLREKERSGELDAQINAVQSAIGACNKLAKDIKAAPGVTVPGRKILGGLFEGPKRIDNKAYLNEFYTRIEGKLTADEANAIRYNVEEEAIFRSDTKDICTYLELKKMCEKPTKEMATLCNKTITVWNSKLGEYGRSKDTGEKQKSALDSIYEKTGKKIDFIGSFFKEEKTTPDAIIFKTDKWGDETFEEEANMAVFEFDYVYYLAQVESVGRGEYRIIGLYRLNSITRDIEKEVTEEWPKGLSSTITGVGVTKVNRYEGKLEIEFWEKEPYEGLPAKMPLVDLKGGIKGLYFATKQYGYGLEAYLESGDVRNFYICSVGENGIPEWDYGIGPIGDDKCAMVEHGKPKALPRLGLDMGDVTKVAERCVRQAFDAYKRGEKKVGTECCKECKMGKPAVAAPSTTCEDFMSPSQCNLMFNLCDPVVCPSSRCDFGGKIPVDDVIQTGVIGGLTLCLHNADEVAVPICLSGIHAGLENYITILKSARDCLQEKLATGKTIGICDQLTSVYICEFFWRQLAPFLKVGIPSLVESLVVGKKSGGEYLTFSDAWKNAQDSAKYFMSYYKEDALRAFKISSIAEAGTPVCRAFVSLRYPNQGDIFDELTRPEVPYQVNAIFHETPMTTATVPAISHYKVYYHIYAGKEKGHYYMVYLRQPPQLGYYETPEIYPVPGAVGYIPVGQFVDVSRDFTGPANYIELCVRIDAKDHCGFGKATTTLAVEKLMESYISKQTAIEITTEKECISGTPGMIAPNLNPQALVEETLEPAIWRRGIIRTCASEDPGKGTEPERWVPIGYCDSKNVKCWLDTKSVEGAIKDIGLQEKTIEEAEKIASDLLEKGFMSRENAETILSIIEKEKPVILAGLEGLTEKKKIDAKIANITASLNNLVESSLAEDVRAKALMQIGAIYNHIVMLLKPEEAAKAEDKEKEEEEEVLPKIELSDILFDFDSDALDVEDKEKLLEELREVDLEQIGKIRVYGYASNEGVEEQEAYNKDLSLRRANAVKEFIEENFPGLSVVAVGKGVTIKFSIEPYTTEQLKEKRAELGNAFKEWAAGDEQLALNRRVVFEVVTKAEAEVEEEEEKEEEIIEEIKTATEKTGIEEELAYIEAGERFLKYKKWQQALDSFEEAEDGLRGILDDESEPFYTRINAKTQLKRIADVLVIEAEGIFRKETFYDVAKEFQDKYLEMANKIEDFVAKREPILELKKPYWLNKEQRDTTREPRYSGVWPVVEGGSAYKGVKFEFTIKKERNLILERFNPVLDSYEIVFNEDIGMAVGKVFTPEKEGEYYFTVSITPDYKPLERLLSRSKPLIVSKWMAEKMEEETREEIEQKWLSEFDTLVKTAEKNWNILSNSERSLCTRVEAKEKFEAVIKQLKRSISLIYSELGLTAALAGRIDKESEKLYFELKEKFYDKADELKEGLERGYLGEVIAAPEEVDKITEAVLSLKVEKPYWVDAKNVDKKLDYYELTDPETPGVITARMVLEAGYAYENTKFSFTLYKSSSSVFEKRQTIPIGTYTFRKGRIMTKAVNLGRDYYYNFGVTSVDCPYRESLKLKSPYVHVTERPGISG